MPIEPPLHHLTATTSRTNRSNGYMSRHWSIPLLSEAPVKSRHPRDVGSSIFCITPKIKALSHAHFIDSKTRFRQHATIGILFIISKDYRKNKNTRSCNNKWDKWLSIFASQSATGSSPICQIFLRCAWQRRQKVVYLRRINTISKQYDTVHNKTDKTAHHTTYLA